jgi:hypothetical protein
MAEQKIEDTKSPAARRGARPFVGPAGGPPAARPLLRPAAPGGRLNHAPFAPPSTPPRPALGITALPIAPVALGADAFPVHDPAEAATAPVPSERTAQHEPTDVESAFTTHEREAEVPDGIVTGDIPAEAPARRPVTSEMVAIDASAAFDAVWGSSITPPTVPTVPSIEPTTPPVDVEALGDDVDAAYSWTDEIAAPETAGSSFGEASVPAAEHGTEDGAAWMGTVTPDSAIPAWLADDSDVAPAREHGSLEGESFEGESLVADVPAVPDPALTHGTRVSAALDRLAERVRGGEIDVSSVAPDAPDAAVLASVLAALLGGSSSR